MDLVITSVSQTAPTFQLTGIASFVAMPTREPSHLLADTIREFHPPQRKQVISTYGQNAASSAITDLSDLSCAHEEADMVPFHASHSFHHVFTKLMIHATDTDVVVLAIAVSSVLQDCEIWVACGHGSKLHFIADS